MEYRKLPPELASHGDFGKALKGPGPMEFTPEMKAKMARDEELKQERIPLAEKCRTGTMSVEETTLPYRLYVPEGMERGEKYPLVLFLHGGGERGEDNLSQMVANDGACVFIRRQLEGKGEKCFVLAPQCSQAGYGWLEQHCLTAKAILDEVMGQYPVDENRLYLTGMSMGGGGCWRMNYMFPELFAAVVPMCSGIAVKSGGEIDEKAAEQAAEAFAGKPLWIFHAEDDVVVPVGTSRALVKALEAQGKKRGQDFFYTEYAAQYGFNHGCWDPAYQWDLMLAWMFQQSNAPVVMPEDPHMPPPEVMEQFMFQEQQKKEARQAYLSCFEAREKKTQDVTLPYRLYVPEGGGEGLPLVVLLHGIGGCGQDNEMQILDNDAVIDWYKAITEGKIEPCCLLVPQCIMPIPYTRWEFEYLEVVHQIVEELVAEFKLDTTRLYLTGLSLGGYGSWSLNRLHPDTFAAVVSCCPACLGGSMMNNWIDHENLEACALTLGNKPLWMFHSEDDMAVPAEITKIMAKKLDEMGSEYHMTIYPAEKHYNHGCWEPAYKDQEMLRWLMAQHL